MHCRALTQDDFDQWINAFRGFILPEKKDGHMRMPSTSFVTLGPVGTMRSVTPDHGVNPILDNLHAVGQVRSRFSLLM
jgi:hypothetical protein